MTDNQHVLNYNQTVKAGDYSRLDLVFLLGTKRTIPVVENSIICVLSRSVVWFSSLRSFLLTEQHLGDFCFVLMFFSLFLSGCVVLCLVFGAETFWHEQHWNLLGQGAVAERQTLFHRNCILVVALGWKKENKSTFFYSKVELFSLGGVLSSTVKFNILFNYTLYCYNVSNGIYLFICKRVCFLLAKWAYHLFNIGT